MDVFSLLTYYSVCLKSKALCCSHSVAKKTKKTVIGQTGIVCCFVKTQWLNHFQHKSLAKALYWVCIMWTVRVIICNVLDVYIFGKQQT